MTVRGLCLLLGGAGLTAVGWLLGWPELSVLGAGAIALVVLAVLCATGGSRVQVQADVTDFRVVRGEPAALRIAMLSAGRRRRLTRLVEGSPATPQRSLAVPHSRRGTETVVQVPVDTSRRGFHPVGPFTVVRGDPWSVVRKQLGQSPEGSVLVRPRTFPVRTGFASVHRQGDSEAMTRRSGDDHFFALRDYVLGDEPRSVHWRSSARSGRLVVKQKVAAAVDGTLLVLDVDGTAYPSTEQFGEGFLEERFEEAVEVIASLCRARVAVGQRVRLATTARIQPQLGLEPSLAALIDTLAVVQPVQPLDCDPVSLAALARRSHCSQIVVVSGAPSAELVGAVRRCGSFSPVVVRVAGVPTGAIPGATVLDISDARALA
ncbi:MAG: hypothetical protein JWP14_2154 [Frankiales bacterium]|nr:hypothetical protein [Frankiales bacterium]